MNEASQAPSSEPEESGSGRAESESQRLDRNLEELLGELRVALPGVQVLFAFLLVVPFNTGFESLTSAQERLYLATLLTAGLAMAFLMAPTAQHRLTFRMQDKRHLVLVGNRLTIAGLGLLALAMTGAIGLVVDVVYDASVAAASAGLVGLTFVFLPYVMPMRRRMAARSPGD